jgi:Concanavalin A-like lectin/glucanases superfamily
VVLKCATPLFSKYNFMPILSSLSVLGAHFSTPPNESFWYDDASDAHHTVTLNGSVAQSDEGGGVKAATISPNSRLLLGNNVGFDFGSDDYTLELFVKSASLLAETSTILEFDFNNRRICADGNQSVVGFYEGSGLGSNYFSGFCSKEAIVNTWAHLAVVRNAGTTTLFFNGVAVSSETSAMTFDNSGQLSFGSRSGSFDGSPFADLSIAGVRVVKGTALYTSNFSVPTTLPTAVSGTQLLLNFGATAMPTV